MMGIFDSFDEHDVLEERLIAIKNDVTRAAFLESLCEKFESWHSLCMSSWNKTCFMQTDFSRAYNLVSDDSIDETSINDFCALLPKMCDRKQFKYSGMFVSALLQRGFDCGENDFVITVPSLHCVGMYVHGTDDRRISYTIHGDVANHCAARMLNAQAVFKDTVGHWHAEFCRDAYVAVQGSAGAQVGFGSKYSEFVLTDVGKNAASDVMQSTVHIRGNCDAGLGINSRGCTFYASESVLDSISHLTRHKCCGFSPQEEVFHSKLNTLCPNRHQK